MPLWRLLAFFGDLARRQESTKNRFLAPNGAPGSNALSIFVKEIDFLTFGIEFSLIFEEIMMEKIPHFFKDARDLFNLATL